MDLGTWRAACWEQQLCSVRDTSPLYHLPLFFWLFLAPFSSPSHTFFLSTTSSWSSLGYTRLRLYAAVFFALFLCISPPLTLSSISLSPFMPLGCSQPFLNSFLIISLSPSIFCLLHSPALPTPAPVVIRFFSHHISSLSSFSLPLARKQHGSRNLADDN